MSAISYTCLRDIVAAMTFLGLADPFSIPAACFNNQEVAGDLTTKENDLSGFIEIRVGRGIPGV